GYSSVLRSTVLSARPATGGAGEFARILFLGGACSFTARAFFLVSPQTNFTVIVISRPLPFGRGSHLANAPTGLAVVPPRGIVPPLGGEDLLGVLCFCLLVLLPLPCLACPRLIFSNFS